MTAPRIPSIYFASKTRHAARWRGMRNAAHSYTIASSWIDERWFDTHGEPRTDLTRDEFEHLWTHCVDEARDADAVILYAEPGDIFRGAFIECGAALAAGKPVIQVGSSKSFAPGDGSDASFTKHPLWQRAGSVGQALLVAQGIVGDAEGWGG